MKNNKFNEVLLQEFTEGNVIYDLDNDIENEEAEQLVEKYSHLIFTDECYDSVYAISKFDTFLIIKLVDYHNHFNWTIKKIYFK